MSMLSTPAGGQPLRKSGSLVGFGTQTNDMSGLPMLPPPPPPPPPPAVPPPPPPPPPPLLLLLLQPTVETVVAPETASTRPRARLAMIFLLMMSPRSLVLAR